MIFTNLQKIVTLDLLIIMNLAVLIYCFVAAQIQRLLNK